MEPLQLLVGFAEALNLLALACAFISAAGVAWMVTRALPARLEKRLRDAERLAVEAADTVASIKTHYAAFLEDAERVLTAVERKRASISTAESKAAKREQMGETERPQTRDELRQWAAAHGHLT